jgi:glycosyltransferase involved in cell wall biosynthesis
VFYGGGANNERIERTKGVTARLSIILPAYNEAGVIGKVLADIRALHPTAELIVVDDGSTDATVEQVAAVEGVRLVQHAYNIGNGAAIKSGMRAATGDVILMMDSDGQHQPADIERIIEPIVNGHYDMVVGARTAESETEVHRDAANLLYNRLGTYIAQHKIEDLTSGFRALRAPIAKGFVGILPNGFSYPTTLTLAMFRSGFTVKYVPIVAKKRVGLSKIRLLRDGVGFLLTILRIGTLFAPMRIFLPLAIAVFSMGAVYGGYLLIFQGRFTNTPPLLLLSGILLFMMGLISEQIALLRLMQANRRGSE